MQRAQKEQVVSDIQEKMKMSKGLFLFEYHGLNVDELTQLRQKFNKIGGELKVYKNTLMKRALKGTEVEKVIGDVFKGPIASAFSYEDVVPAAKTLVDFEKRNEESLDIKVGVLDSKKLELAQIKQLAKLPPREVLLGQLVRTLAAPLSGLVNVLAAVPRSFLYALKAVEQKKSNESK